MRNRHPIISTIVMVPIACVVALPFYYIVVNTVKTQPETLASPLALPSRLNFENYIAVFQQTPVLRTLVNTIYVTTLSIALMLWIGSLAAYAVVIGRGRIATVMGFILAVAFVIPGQATLIPQYEIFAKAHLVDSLNGLVLLYSTGSIFCYFLIVGYLRSVPNELFEAARVDGAGSWRIYWSIALPLIRPILVTVGVFQTMWVWNDFLIPSVFISSPGKQTLVLQVYTAVGQFSTNWPMFMTLTVVVLLPMVLFFALTQRHIVSGLVAGAIKG